MAKMTERQIGTLQSEEREQLSALIKRYYNGVNKEFIDLRTLKGPCFDIILLKDKEKVLAASYYHLLKAKIPFSEKESYILQFGQALKHKDYKGNVIWKQGGWYARKKIGWLYPFKRVVGLSTINSPKVLEHFTKLFPVNYPFHRVGTTLNMREFINEYFRELRNTPIQVDESFCYNDPHFEQIDITEDWEKYFKAKDPAINEFFIQTGIIRMENDRIFRTNRHLVAVGYRSPDNLLHLFERKANAN